MKDLPTTFSEPWNITFQIPAWRMELRRQGRDAIPDIACRLLHFRSRVDDCSDATKRLALSECGIELITGFIGDGTWSDYERSRSGEPRDAKGLPALGFVGRAGTNDLRWHVAATSDGEFDQYAKIIEKSVLPGVVLSVFLYGHKSVAVEGDRGEMFHRAPIMTCSFSVDRGEFPLD